MPNQPFQFVCALGLIVALAMTVNAQEPSSESSASQGTSAGSKNPADTKESGSKPTSSTNQVPSTAEKRRKRPPAVIHSDQNKIVVPEGGAKEPPAQIAPGLAPDEAKRNRHEAEQWLTATDGQLKELSNRHLSESRQDIVAQVRQLPARRALCA